MRRALPSLAVPALDALTALSLGSTDSLADTSLLASLHPSFPRLHAAVVAALVTTVAGLYLVSIAPCISLFCHLLFV